MSRLKQLREYVNGRLDVLDAHTRQSAYVHLYGVSLAATLIAEKRGENAELASMAAMLHDLAAYESGSYDDHAHRGAALARTILDNLGLTTPEETDMICSAIYNHDSKEQTDSPFDEVLKDADVMHHTMNDLSKPVKEKERVRYEALRREFGLPDRS
ncbi:MAG: HD domain-containing protein [Atopobiaceae bacterium]